MQKKHKSSIKTILVVLLCIFGIAAFICYFVNNQVLRWLAIFLFMIAAAILALRDNPEQAFPSLFLAVICTAIITFSPMLIWSEGGSGPTDTPSPSINFNTPSPPTDSEAPLSTFTEGTSASGLVTDNIHNLTMTIYPAEKIDWNTGMIDELWPIGGDFKVYDVETGIIWWAHRVSGSGHVDAEPMTDEDTASLLECYDIDSTQVIPTEMLIQRRPILVTIGEHTFACSLYASPLSGSEGDVITNNIFDGKVCIHFTNSYTHGLMAVDSSHQEAIEYAWQNAPYGHIPTSIPETNTPDQLVTAKNEKVHVRGEEFYGRSTWKNITAANYTLAIGSTNLFSLEKEGNKLCRKFEIKEDGSLSLVFSYFRDKERTINASQDPDIRDTDDWIITIVSGNYVIYKGYVNRRNYNTLFEYDLLKGTYYFVAQKVSSPSKHWYLTIETDFHVK